MHTIDERLREFALTYSMATGNNLTLLDNALGQMPASTSTLGQALLNLLDFDEVQANFQAVLSGLDVSQDDYETFITKHNFVYNLHCLRCEQGIVGLAVTDPVRMDPVTADVVDGLATEHHLSLSQINDLRNRLAQIPVLPWERIGRMGKALKLICQSLFQMSNLSAQAHYTLTVSPVQQEAALSPAPPQPAPEDARGTPFQYSSNLYQLIKDVIKAGDPQRMTLLLKQIDLGSLPFDQMARHNFIRSLKNTAIVFATSYTNAAIEADAPFETITELLYKTTSAIEAQDDPKQILKIMYENPVEFCKCVEAHNQKKSSKLVRQILDYLKDNFQSELTLDDLASLTDRNKQYLSGVIKRETGRTLPDNINHLRVSEAKRLLILTESPIADIARDVGFCYQNHFSAVFKKLVGLTPSEYRNRFGSTTSK
jgi:AraC-like DNA-binding protein